MTDRAPNCRAIINADDLGYSGEVNDAIFELMAAGRITSATLMANGPRVREAAVQVARFPGCSFGAHLNISEFPPLAGRNTVACLLQDGVLTRETLSMSPAPACIRAVYSEFCAQVERLLALGVPISHLDSHHHAHTIPHVLPALKAVQRRYSIRRVRLSKNIYTADEPCAASLLWKKRLYNWTLRHAYRTETTDGFTEFVSFCEEAARRTLPHRTVELMTHPGARSASNETAILLTDWRAPLLVRVGLISYNQLVHGL